MASTAVAVETAPNVQGVCKDCGAGTLNNRYVPVFEVDEYSASCLFCGSTHVDLWKNLTDNCTAVPAHVRCIVL